jgi:arylsulfatase A-like enzyme
MDCHLPYKLQSPERHRFVDEDRKAEVESVPQEPFAVMAGRETLSAQDLEDLRALYDGCLSYLDKHVARLDRRLRELGLAQNTLLAITSDHGESFGEHGLLDHQYGLYENLLSVPLVIRMPDEGEVGEDERLVQLVDLVPTFLELAGGAPESDEMQQAVPFLGAPRRPVVMAEYLVPNVRAIRRRFPDADVERFDVALRSISTGTEKLIWGSDGRTELYDLEADPGETKSMATVRPDVVRRLRATFEERLGDWPVKEAVPGPKPVDAAVKARLEDLGYL